MHIVKTELAGGHLLDPKYIIRACTHNNPQDYFLAEYSSQETFTFVDYQNTDIEYLEKNGIIFSENDNHGFCMSNVDAKNKFSRDFLNCTSVVAIGESKETGKNISFLTHQDPNYFLSTARSKDNPYISRQEFFIEHLQKKLSELQEKSNDKTIDIVLLGGAYLRPYFSFSKSEYEKSITFLSDVIYTHTGLQPVVIGGPSSSFAEEEYPYKGVYVFTDERNIIYYKNDTILTTNISYVANEVGEIVKNFSRKK